MIPEAFEFSSPLNPLNLESLLLSPSRIPHMPAQWAWYARMVVNAGYSLRVTNSLHPASLG